MRFLPSIILAAAATLLGGAMAAPLNVHPGTAADLVLTANNTVNATQPPSNGPESSSGALSLALTNNLNGGAVNCYVTGLDSNNELVLLQTDGTFYRPTATNSGVPQPINAPIAIAMNGYGQTTHITIPGYISAARVWFAEGELQFFVVKGGNGAPSLVEPSAVNPSDPSADVNWGFVELTNTAGGLYANISYVDFVGMPLGMTLTATDGSTQSARGLSANAVSSICNDLAAQSAKDGAEWSDLCVKGTNGAPLRVLNPQDYLSINSNAFSSYWTSYVNQVWSYYSTNTLTIDTQASAGNVACHVQNGQMTCAGDNRGYSAPNAGDIFGCNSNTFAIQGGDNGVHYAVVPRLCAAFNRATFFASGGSTQPGPSSSEYYTSSPCNHYSRIVHSYEVDGKGYAFSYDDVNPDGENASGVVSTGSPQLLSITFGGA